MRESHLDFLDGAKKGRHTAGSSELLSFEKKEESESLHLHLQQHADQRFRILQFFQKYNFNKPPKPQRWRGARKGSRSSHLACETKVQSDDGKE